MGKLGHRQRVKQEPKDKNVTHAQEKTIAAIFLNRFSRQDGGYDLNAARRGSRRVFLGGGSVGTIKK